MRVTLFLVATLTTVLLIDSTILAKPNCPEPLRVLATVRGMIPSPDNRYIAVAESETATTLFNRATLKRVPKGSFGWIDKEDGRDDDIDIMTFLGAQPILLRANERGHAVRLYDVITKKEIELPDELMKRRFLTVSTNGRWLVFERGDFVTNDSSYHELEIYGVLEEATILKIKMPLDSRGLSTAIQQAAFFDENTKIAVARSDYDTGETGIHLYDLQTDTEIPLPKGLVRGNGCGGGLKVSPDGRFMAMLGVNMASMDLRTFDLKADPKKAKVRYLRGLDYRITSFAFSPDSSFIAGAGASRTIKLWDPATGKIQKSLKFRYGKVTPDGPSLISNAVLEMALSKDGRYLAAAATDGGIRLWNTQTGQLLAERFYNHENKQRPLLTVRFSADDKSLFTVGEWGDTALVWNLKDLK
jgi:WD40 repeat protein